MIKHTKNILSALVLITLIIGLNWRSNKIENDVYAATPTANSTTAVQQSGSATSSEETTMDCDSRLYIKGNQLLGDYQQYLTTHFASKEATSTLIAPALKRLELLKSDLTTELNQYFKMQEIGKPGRPAERGQMLTACTKMVDDLIADGEKMLELAVGTNSAVKKALIFDEKYRQINDKLRGLNQEMMKMNANLSTFEKKVPCYVQYCL